MKFRIIASVLLVVLLSFAATSTQAAPWRGGYGHRGGWCAPAVRVYAPRVVIGGGYYGGGYYGHPHYCGPRNYGPRYYGPHCYGGGYRRGRY